MRRVALAIQLLTTALPASLFALCAVAGLSGSAARGEAVACPVSSVGWALAHQMSCAIRQEKVGQGPPYDYSNVDGLETGALHCWASQQWHTGLIGEPESSEEDAIADDAPAADPPSDDAAPSSEESEEAATDSSAEERLEFESYVADPDGAAKKGLATRVSPPWYSAEEDEAVPVGLDDSREPFRDPVDPGNRASDWVHVPKTSNWSWTPWAPFANLPLTELIWVALVIAAILLGGLLVFALIKSRIGENQGAAEEVAEEAEDPLAAQERIERLPFELRQGVHDFLDEARRLAAAGKYEEALVYLFSHALVQLDRSHRIRLAKGKTNRQYVAEIESSPPLARLLSELADDFEGVFFGKYPLSQAKYEQNLDRIERFRNLLQQASHG